MTSNALLVMQHGHDIMCDLLGNFLCHLASNFFFDGFHIHITCWLLPLSVHASIVRLMLPTTVTRHTTHVAYLFWATQDLYEHILFPNQSESWRLKGSLLLYNLFRYTFSRIFQPTNLSTSFWLHQSTLCTQPIPWAATLKLVPRITNAMGG